VAVVVGKTILSKACMGLYGSPAGKIRGVAGGLFTFKYYGVVVFKTAIAAKEDIRIYYVCLSH
jgi:hypothetical protein